MVAIAPDKPNWFHTAFQLKGSILPSILPRVLLFGSWGGLISWIQTTGLTFDLSILGDLTNNVASNLVLGLLLVFRTNTAYDRYWEGRKAWGTLVVNIRNLAREIQMGVQTPDDMAQAEKVEILRLLGGFAIATKLHLRQTPFTPELLKLMPDGKQTQFSIAKNPPFEIVLYLGHYLQQQYQQKNLDGNQWYAATSLLSQLIEGLTSCERILGTPIPPAYAVYLKWLLLLYSLCLPSSLVNHLHLWTGVLTAIISAVLLGVEEIGNEIEDPFGTDPNDLPLEDLCDTVLSNVEGAIAFPINFPDLSIPSNTNSNQKL